MTRDPAIIETIVGLWRHVRSQAFHGPGCGCCGAQPVVLDPEALREDIDYMLRQQCRSRSDEAALAILDRAASRAEFVGWISAINDDITSEESRDRLLADVAVTLHSMTSADFSTPSFEPIAR